MATFGEFITTGSGAYSSNAASRGSASCDYELWADQASTSVSSPTFLTMRVSRLELGRCLYVECSPGVRCCANLICVSQYHRQSHSIRIRIGQWVCICYLCYSHTVCYACRISERYRLPERQRLRGY